MKPEQRQFTEDMGQHMAGWGLPRTTGRIYGYLLIQPQPASLDQIAADLELAKSGVSVAMRQLLALGLARSIGQRGSRRLLYEALYDLEAVLSARNAQMLDLVERLHQGFQAAPAGPTRERLADMAAIMQDCVDEIGELVHRIRKRRRARREANAAVPSRG
jgi:DNA-binding transcriptional regulator GbsR (MarR family)